MTPGDFQNFVECSGASESVHNDYAARARGNGFLDPGRIKIECLRIDINEYRYSAFVPKNIGDGDESERGNDDFITFGDAQRANGKMQGAGSGIHGDSVRSANIARDGILKFFHLWTATKPAGAKHRADGGNVRIVDVGSREWNSHYVP